MLELGTSEMALLRFGLNETEDKEWLDKLTSTRLGGRKCKCYKGLCNGECLTGAAKAGTIF